MTDAQPKHARIADLLRAAIAAGRYRAGERLPGEEALAKEYGTSVVTVQKALQLLKNEGLATGLRGSGVYVQDLQFVGRHGSPRRALGEWGDGPRIWPADETRPVTIDQVTTAEVPPPSRVAEVLGLDPEEKVRAFDSRYLVDGRPVKLVRVYLPFSSSIGHVADGGSVPGNLFSLLRELGLTAAHIREEVRGRTPAGSDASGLEIPIGRTLLDAYRIAFAEDGQVLGVEQTVMDSTAYVAEYAYDV
ncbi:GntR family transcriptional regulator [Streptomyces sp. MMBL 11-1]|uniref:GntR family transcriptional regulator n=1 Tax=Streptomyces sp. MMBL 11-1 TaxID=3026420 RepID=UPI00235E60C5|nr:GntR family transcriptional regulator [Streptomyces sp. MMBL 11-1]